MGAFSHLMNVPTAARHTVLLPPSAFAETWARRPKSPTLVGIRLLSEAQVEFAQVDARQKAWEAHPEPTDVEFRLDVFNDWNITNILARAMCRAEDVNVCFFAPGPEDLIREGLSPGGIRRLWDEFTRVSVIEGPLRPEADDEALAVAWPELQATIAAASPGAQSHARRLLWAALEELRTEA